MTEVNISEIKSREEMIRLLDGYSVERKEELDQKKVKRGLVKSYLLETVDGFQDTEKILSDILTPFASELIQVDEGLYKILDKNSGKSQLNDTCKSMTTELENVGFAVCPTFCLGVKCDFTNSIYLVVDSNDTIKLGLSEHGEIKVVEGQPKTDPRPLYFIPLDPSVEQNEYGRKTLEQRLLSEILSLIGRAKIPSKIQFVCEELLEKATWGMYGIWGDRNARLNLKRKVNTFLRDKVESLFPNNLQKEQDKWILNFNSPQDKEAILSSFQKIREIGELNTPPQLELFDQNK